ncbi:hypothetical protein FL857_07935 [Criibacterium bergeronii]|uniref:Methyl-accepting chemotaxis protein n=1 Tax=Criibacterium bergeronii TaxID=1871336 RepID=A0A552V3K4_9FIRM|nr:hypothetical protein [Criibacterium bergeronii]MBS6064077.1 hypothetical protein [Peptostreptococcaceae bacterium]TRW25049.1 hypothetical protein FL857_07935 [Criibacterium bergeronii]
MAETSEELTATSQTTLNSATEVASAVGNIAEGATSQAQDTTSAASDIQVVHDLMDNTSKLISELNDSIAVINEKKELGQTSLKKLVEVTKKVTMRLKR